LNILENEMRTSYARATAYLTSILVSLLTVLPAQAAFTVSSWTAATPSSVDAFDVSQGTTVVTSTAIFAGYDIRSAIGFLQPTVSEPEIAYFADSSPGFVTSFVFRTSVPVAVSGFSLLTYDDSFGGVGNINRGFSSIAFSGSTDGINFNVLASGNVVNSYTAGYGISGIQVVGSFAPTTAQFFKFEGTQANQFGARLVELDALAAPVPEPSSLALAAAGLVVVCSAVRRRKGRY